MISSSSSSSIGTTTLSWVSACSTAVEHSQQELLQSAVASGTSNPQLGGSIDIKHFNVQLIHTKLKT
jgi:hypothetical protein